MDLVPYLLKIFFEFKKSVLDRFHSRFTLCCILPEKVLLPPLPKFNFRCAKVASYDDLDGVFINTVVDNFGSRKDGFNTCLRSVELLKPSVSVATVGDSKL
mmetsp:Transcript_2690/g.3864  ORF Transcript_2690/g.3864 Transcript_2690/m.3864 type:complete len:101 (-) Transcript_2690:26-328(-)